ncbi:hypothetical protein ACET3Z_025470 [Daucus carota]
MATLSHSESSRLYSWWWDSHISPKNSKWLHDNLTDMDAKVKSMIKLIEEDADSFARRAEMYYKKRPELIKLVEEFYRAYRALAERYDYATGELRQAHRTIAKAFPDQVPFVLSDESTSASSNVTEIPLVSSSFFDIDDLDKNALMFPASDQHSVKAVQFRSESSDAIVSKQELQQHDQMIGMEVVPGNVKSAEGRIEKSLPNKVSILLNENEELNAKLLFESERASKAESEVQYLKKALTDMQAVKEAVQFQYQQNVDKLSSLKGELISAEMDSKKLNEQASKAESEFLSLKNAIVKLEEERDAVSYKNKDCLERISDLEATILHTQADRKELEERTLKAEVETQILKKDLSRLEAEKEAGLLQYKQCLEKISDLEKKVFVAEGDARYLKQKAEIAETEVVRLKVILAEVTAQKEATALQYKACLEKISNLESEISYFQVEIKCLKTEILSGDTKLRTAEDKCDMLEMSNQTLRLEADNLFKKIALKDKELTEKHGDLEKLQAALQDERLRYAHVEASLVKLQNMHCQSQEEQRNLTLELKSGLELLKDINLCKHGLEEDIQQIKDENCSLKEQNSSSTTSMMDLQNEILGLTRMKERFDEEVEMQLGKSNALQKEISCLKEEIVYLNRNYQTLVKQVEMVGLDPKCFGTSVRELKDENSQLKQLNDKEKDEKESLYKKLVNMVELMEKNTALQGSLSDVTNDLEGSQEQAKVLQESCNILHGEKCALVAEKDALISQLKLITTTMQELSEKNNVLESSLCSANSELQSMRKKSESLEELCQFLGDEKANLLNERSTLAAQLEVVEKKIINLEKRFTEFEGNYSVMKMAKESLDSPPLEDLIVSLKAGKHEHESLKQLTESRLASVEERICRLQEESRQSKRDFQDEFEKSVVSQFEIYILQKFVADMEEKNYLLLAECQKQIEASKLADQLISELENESLEQQVEEEFMLAEIEKLRSGLHQVRKALENGASSGSDKLSENDHISVHHILEDIAIMKHSLLKYNDDMQRLVIENSVLLTFFGQLRLEGLEVESEKNHIDQVSKTMSHEYLIMQNEWHKILEMNRKLKSVTTLNAEGQYPTIKQAGMQSSYLQSEEEYSHTFEGNRPSSKSFPNMVQSLREVNREDNVLKNTLSHGKLSTIFSSLRTKNAGELALLSEDISKLYEVNCELVNEVSTLREELGMHEIEKLFMEDSLEKLERDLFELKNLNCRLKLELLSANDYLSEGEEELFDAEMKLVVVENLNSELRREVDRLKREYKQSESIRENQEILMQKMSEDNANQNKNIQDMLEVKVKLESELAMLSEEIQERRTREEYLNSELQEKQNEFELWDAEAATFCFDLQVSAIHELFFEDKVYELCGVCGSLQDENASKTQEIKLLKEKVSSQSGEIRGLKSHLCPHSLAVGSLKEDVDSIEHNFLAWANLDVANCQIPKDMELGFHAHEKGEDQDLYVLDEILELQKLQNRIKEVEKVVIEEMKRLKRQESSRFNLKIETAGRDIVDLKSRCRLVRQKSKQKEEGRLEDESRDNITFHKTMPEILEVKNVILMKGIPLDQVSGGSLCGRSRRRNSLPAEQIRWETNDANHRVDQNLIELQNQVYEPTKNVVYKDYESVEQSSENPSSELDMEKELGVDKLQVSTTTSVPNRGGNKKKILERLASDGQKLANIQTNVQDLRRKLETNKKGRNSKNVDLETVKEQLLEAEETTMQLINLNGQMTRKIEDIPVSKDGQRSIDLEKAASFQKKKVSEQARKESEKIGRLQLEVQKIHYAVLQLDDGKKNKVTNRFSRTKSRTTVILRDFIHSGRRSSVRKKKGRLCGCFKPSSTNAGGSM